MGGRGATGTRGRGVGLGGGGAFTITQNAGGGVTITPNNQNNANAQNIMGAGSGISDVNSHTTYFSPADYATVSDMNSDGFAFAQRSGKWVPVGYFQTGYYSNVNSELRDLANGKRSKLTPQTQKVVDAMDRNMRPLNAPMDSVRWTDTTALADNIGLRGATNSQIISRLSKGDAISVKNDYTSSSWNPKDNAVAGNAGRYVMQKMHYAKGAKVAFSPTRKEGEVVGARGVAQRYSNARTQRMLVTNTKGRRQYADVLVVDVYVD